MKIVHVIPGSGGTFYCQNCVRDLALVQALRRAGHDVVMAPMYLPLELNDPGIVNDSPLFYGAVKVYLKETVSWLRKAPPWLNRLLDAAPVLAMAAKRSGSTSAPGLSELTLSMLAGEQGNQADELERLIQWLKTEVRPDLICISNALLLGLARRMKAETGARIICYLQDEDTWIEAMPVDFQKRIWAAMAEKVPEVDRFIAVSHYYAGVMAGKIGIPAAKMAVVYPGTDFSGFLPSNPVSGSPVIGYLSRMTGSLGMDILVDAFVRLKQAGRIPGLKLRLAGGHTSNDHAFISRQMARIKKAGYAAEVEIIDEFDLASRARFFAALSVLSVPVPQGEAFGAYIIEALGCGVPVVQPQAGAFPELVATTGGGIIYDPNDSVELAAALESLLLNPERAKALGEIGRQKVLQNFSIEKTAEATLAIYKQVVGSD